MIPNDRVLPEWGKRYRPNLELTSNKRDEYHLNKAMRDQDYYIVVKQAKSKVNITGNQLPSSCQSAAHNIPSGSR